MTTSIHTSYASLADLPTRYAGAADYWLSPAERQIWQQARSAVRRTTFLAGRIVAKRLLRERVADIARHRMPPAPAAIHLDSAGGQRPALFVCGQRIDWAVSITHTDRGVLAAVSTEPGVTLGVDLVLPRAAERLTWCFTPAEHRWLAAQPPHRPMREQLWAMKEALYKACQQGEGFAPRQIEIVPGRDAVYPRLDPTRAVRRVQGWRVDGQFAALAVVEPRHADNLRPTYSPNPAADAGPACLTS